MSMSVPSNTQSTLDMSQIQTDMSKELLTKTYDAMSNNYKEAIRLLNEKDKTSSTQYELALERDERLESMTNDYNNSKIKEETFKRRLEYLSDDTIKFYRPIKILRLLGIILVSLIIVFFSYLFFESKGKTKMESISFSILILIGIIILRQVGMFYWNRFN
jgi:hypothetical protein